MATTRLIRSSIDAQTNNRNDRNNDRNDRNDRNDNKNFGKKGNKYRDEPQQPKISNENMSFQRSTKIDLRPQEPRENLTNMNLTEGDNLGKWGRKDLAKEEKAAADPKKKGGAAAKKGAAA